MRFSLSVSLAFGWMRVYWILGILPSVMDRLKYASGGTPEKSEKFRRARPPSTSCCTSHENGAILVAHHHLVWLLWQS